MIYFGNMINQQRCFQPYAMSEPLLEIFTTGDFWKSSPEFSDFAESTYSVLIKVRHCFTQWVSVISTEPDFTASLKTHFNQSLSQRLTVTNSPTD